MKRGNPAVILGPGGGSFDPKEDGDRLMREFRRTAYHQPGDDLGQPFNWRAAQRFTQLHRELVMGLAAQPEPPRWRPGSFFGELFRSGR